MSERRKILDLIEAQREATDKRVAEGIEAYRKGDAVLKFTDQNGTCGFRGFYGQYELTLDVNGETITKTVDLSPKADNEFTVKL